MAKLCVMCGSLCAYFLLILVNSAVSSIDDYHYDVVNQIQKSNFFQTTEFLQHIQKRDVDNNQSNSPSQPNETTVPSKPNDTNVVQNNGSRSMENANTAINKTSTDKISTIKQKLGKTPKILLNTTKPSLEDFSKNLGVNGTGQRKNVTSIKPILLTDHTLPIVLPIQNATTQNETVINDNNPPKIFEDKELNETLTKKNLTEQEDTHLYYNSSLKTDPVMGQYFWVDLTNRSDAKVNELLSKSHRRAATVQLSFDFPFYGHLIKNVTIATGGFLYTGDYVHSWLAATQYIAPLMANFDTSISNDSFIRYGDNGTAFTVEWDKVALQDKPNEGEFTFQTTLHKNGDIVFVYQNVPLLIEKIEDDHHPVKVGLSDAYIIDRTIFFVRRKSIYEYHRVDFLKEDIKNWTVIYLKALPTCLEAHDCNACVNKKIPKVQCYWCPGINRCSSGVDRNRQDWLTKNCDKKQISNETFCSGVSGDDIFDKSNKTWSHDANEFQHHREEASFSKTASRFYDSNHIETNRPVKMGVSSIVAILFLITMVAGLGVWILYAYRNPHTTSGQILIRYRPSQWRWRRGEARYTAATIHM